MTWTINCTKKTKKRTKTELVNSVVSVAIVMISKYIYIYIYIYIPVRHQRRVFPHIIPAYVSVLDPATLQGVLHR